jgi:hypothetical protein
VASAPRAAAAKIQFKARMRRKSAKKAIGRIEIIVFPCVLAAMVMARAYTSNVAVPWFIVANPARLCHKP